IQSRCQRYDFRLIPHPLIADQVRRILALEGIRADDEAIAIVSREAAGSMRDALTLLDQIVAFSTGYLVGSEVARALGLAAHQSILQIVQGVLEGNARAVLSSIAALAESGADMLHLLRQLLDLFRDLVVFRVAETEAALIETSGFPRATLSKLMEGVDLLELQRAFS